MFCWNIKYRLLLTEVPRNFIATVIRYSEQLGIQTLHSPWLHVHVYV